MWPLTPLLHNAPRGLEPGLVGLIFLASYVHSHADGSAYVCQICPQSDICLAFSQYFAICDPQIPLKCPLGLEGLIF